MIKIIIYKATNIKNGKIYIGLTTKTLEERIKHHKRDSLRMDTYFYRAIKKYGWEEGFTHEVLYEHLTQNEAEKMEIELIKQYNSTNKNFGYNHAHGGNYSGTPTEETKQKIREKLKGQKLSEETKKKMSISRSREKNGKAVKVGKFDVNGNLIQSWGCMTSASDDVGVSNKVIWRYCKKLSPDPKGFIWEYL